LRVRVKELAQEAKYIRLEETRIKSKQKIMPCPTDYDWVNKCWKDIPDKNSSEWRQLNSHRRVEVRGAARAAQLAYGFLRDVPYKVIEPKTHTSVYWMNQIKKEVKRLATKFGGLEYGKTFDEEVEQWFNVVEVGA
jgi:hypothetical protein